MYVKNDVPYSCYFATIVNYSNQLLPVNFQWYVYCYITQNKAFPRLFCVELVCVSKLYCLQLNTNADFLNRITLSHWNLKIVNIVKGNSRKYGIFLLTDFLNINLWSICIYITICFNGCMCTNGKFYGFFLIFRRRVISLKHENSAFENK